MIVGVISDTHGLLRPEALAAMAGSTHILHAGDIGRPGIVERLVDIAPVTAIRGNVDGADWASIYPETRTVQLGGCRVHLVHDRKDIGLLPSAEGIDVVVSGHSHRARIETIDDVLYLNPGAAGPRRFGLPVSVARLDLGDAARAEIVMLEV